MFYLNSCITKCNLEYLLPIQMDPTFIRFNCHPVSRVECLLQVPSLDLFFSTKKSDVNDSMLADISQTPRSSDCESCPISVFSDKFVLSIFSVLYGKFICIVYFIFFLNQGRHFTVISSQICLRKMKYKFTCVPLQPTQVDLAQDKLPPLPQLMVLVAVGTAELVIPVGFQTPQPLQLQQTILAPVQVLEDLASQAVCLIFPCTFFIPMVQVYSAGWQVMETLVTRHSLVLVRHHSYYSSE